MTAISWTSLYRYSDINASGLPVSDCRTVPAMTTEFGRRLRQARNAAQLTQVQLSKAAGIGQSTLAELEKSGYGSARVVDLATALNVSPQWLATGAGPMHADGGAQPIDLDNNPDYPAVRRVRFKLSAGIHGYGVDYDGMGDDAPIVFRREWFSRNGYQPGKLLAVRVANGSMEPGLWDGDTVVINTAQTEPKDGAVFAVNYEGHLVIKRLVRDAGQWWLVSDNPDQRRYPRKVCDEHAFLLGEIVHKQSEKI